MLYRAIGPIYIGLYSTSGGVVDREWSSSDITWFHFSVFTFWNSVFWSHPVFRFFQVEIIFCKNDQTNRSAYYDTPMYTLGFTDVQFGGGQKWPLFGVIFGPPSEPLCVRFWAKTGSKTDPKMGRKHLIEENSVFRPFFGPFLVQFQNTFVWEKWRKRGPKQTPKWVEKHLKSAVLGASYHMKNGTFGCKNDPFLGVIFGPRS